MKSTKYISIKFRKTLAFLLLFYFVLSPLLFAFPVEQCSDSCPMHDELGSCAMPMADMEQSGCNMDMTDTNNSISNQNSCDMELSMNSCMIEKYYDSSNNFVVTQKYQSIITFSIISIIDQFTDSNKSTVHENILTFVNEKSPPIYITVQSFLI